MQFDRRKNKKKPDFVTSHLFIYSQRGATTLPEHDGGPFPQLEAGNEALEGGLCRRQEVRGVRYQRLSQTLSRLRGCLARTLRSSSASRTTTASTMRVGVRGSRYPRYAIFRSGTHCGTRLRRLQAVVRGAKFLGTRFRTRDTPTCRTCTCPTRIWRRFLLIPAVAK